MKAAKAKKIEKKGWKMGSAQDFLGLSDEEAEFIEMKVRLSRKLKELRKKNQLSQTEMADVLGSSQSRIAKMESGDPSVSVDLLMKGMLALGASRKDIAKVLGSSQKAA